MWTSRFNQSARQQGTVEKIYHCAKTDTGVSMDWMDGKRVNHEHFTMAELESMRIRVPELISNPELFRIDLQEHKIYVSQLGRGI
jgi:hypothetical protein